MKAVVTVTGKDTKGIIAKVSTLCSENGANIVEITQSVIAEYFAPVALYHPRVRFDKDVYVSFHPDETSTCEDIFNAS